MRRLFLVFIFLICSSCLFSQNTALAKFRNNQQTSPSNQPIDYNQTYTSNLENKPKDIKPIFPKDATQKYLDEASKNSRPNKKGEASFIKYEHKVPQNRKVFPTQRNEVINDKESIKWTNKNTSSFNIRIEPSQGVVGTSNIAMQFETVAQILRQNISWMMPTKVDVDIYASRESFMYNNPTNASDWTVAFFDPSVNKIVMYDNTEDEQTMVKKFGHELTHLLVENTFNPKNSKAPYKEPPIWLNEGLAVNMEDIIKTEKFGGVWAYDLIVMNIFSQGEKQLLKERQQRGGLSDKEKRRLQRFAVSDAVVFFKNFAEFMEDDSYDRAVAANKVDDWYLQAYAMVRFLFRPTYDRNPKKRMQFEQFTKLLSQYQVKKDSNGKPMLNSEGKKVATRATMEEALKQAYRYRSITDFEIDFWKWLTDLQIDGRKHIKQRFRK